MSETNIETNEYRATQDWPYCISSGGVVYRDHEGQRQYVLLYRGDKGNYGRWGNTWHLPKGTLTKYEPIETCALREIREESGLDGEIVIYLGSLRDAWFSDVSQKQIDKTVHYFLVKWLAGDGSDMDQEHDRMEWFPAPKAIEKLNSIPEKGEAEIIKRAEAFFSIKK